MKQHNPSVVRVVMKDGQAIDFQATGWRKVADTLLILQGDKIVSWFPRIQTRAVGHPIT